MYGLDILNITALQPVGFVCITMDLDFSCDFFLTLGKHFFKISLLEICNQFNKNYGLLVFPFANPLVYINVLSNQRIEMFQCLNPSYTKGGGGGRSPKGFSP